MSAGAVVRMAAAPRSRGRRSQPKFDFEQLMRFCGVRDMPTMADRLRLSVNVVRNLVARGISWSRADEMAVRCGVMPWRRWAEWAEADPADWMVCCWPTTATTTWSPVPPATVSTAQGATPLGWSRRWRREALPPLPPGLATTKNPRVFEPEGCVPFRSTWYLRPPQERRRLP